MEERTAKDELPVRHFLNDLRDAFPKAEKARKEITAFGQQKLRKQLKNGTLPISLRKIK